MFAVSPFDTATHVWTTRGLLPAAFLSYSEEHRPSRDCVVHARQWSLSGEVVRRDVWVEGLRPLVGAARENFV